MLSMTGYGEAHRQEAGLSIAVEVRTINSRYFKLSVRAGEMYAALEPDLEALVRQHVKRGTIQVSVRIDRGKRAEDYQLNTIALAAYREQLETLHAEWHINEPVTLERLLVLPGVVDEHVPDERELADEWPLIARTVEDALAQLAEMRGKEGAAMAADLRANAGQIAQALDSIAARAPQVVEGYRSRLEERLRKLLADYSLTLDPTDLLREVSLFAERSDISEEVVRLRSHLEQFDAALDLEDSSGRKLEFVIQEMHRETNTIGSKANDVEIARHVIEIKTAIERIREMIQNVE
ncbi:MAG: YicC/YloC family endoribonuclease [Pirellulales bacterium]